MRSSRLAWDHRDPADRMIVATAIERDDVLLTADEAILAYAAAGHLQAIDARR
jgi:PIN domain nuclease of toxin-antitoxin system